LAMMAAMRSKLLTCSLLMISCVFIPRFSLLNPHLTACGGNTSPQLLLRIPTAKGLMFFREKHASKRCFRGF
jgi:hypothetical protein